MHCSAEEEFKTKSAKKVGACLGNRDRINLRANWQSDSFDVVAITINECRNHTHNGNRCKSP